MTQYRLITELPAPTGRQHTPLLIPGISHGGPGHLRGNVLDWLIEAERAGAHTVLLAADLADLAADVATICRYVVTDSTAVEQEAHRRFGPERVLRVSSTDPADAAGWIGRLPRPESRTLRRRIRSAAGTFPLIRSLYARMRRGSR